MVNGFIEERAENTSMDDQDIIELDIGGLIGALWDHILLIILSTIIVAGIAFCAKTALAVRAVPTYSSKTSILVQAREEEGALTSVDLQLSTSLAQDYIQLIRSNDVMATVIDELDLVDKSGEPMTVDALLAKVNVSLISNTRVISIAVTDSSPKLAQQIANTVRDTAFDYIKEVTNTEAFSVAAYANLPLEPDNVYSVAARLREAVIYGVLACAAICVVIAVPFFLDMRLRTGEQVERYLGVSVFGTITVQEGGMTKARRNGK